VTLYAIATLANGTPSVIQHTVPAERCEDYADYFRRKHPTAIIWCRSELARPNIWDHVPRTKLWDHIPRENAVEYLPDPMDMLGMPTAR
jgi:hypothetical protein